ncbi:MAG: DEAD/DEAH box helicase, partial [Erysipelotrichaceae bacterium]|nr:DEAD/DEAH box helicase [Erysipelotrichaceae bacterium]
ILRAYHKKKKYYRLKDGTFVNLEQNEELSELVKLDRQLYLSNQKMEDGQYVLDPSVAMRLANTDDAFEQMQVLRDESFNQLMDSLNHWNQSSLEIPERYETVLRDYQKDGYRWIKQLEQLGFHGILADDMGLGKTLQCISVLDSARSSEHHSLIVCPSSLLFNWQQELQRFAPDVTSQIIMGNQMLRKELIRKIADYDVSITSYDYLKRDIEQYNSLSLYYVVLDEAQYIKNQKTQSALSVKQLQCEHRLAMTGTPIENNLAELWSIFDFLMPGFLFNYHYFQTNYERPVVRDEDQELSEELKKMVSPFILRRRKNDVLRELPEKTEVVVPITFESDEWKQYLANLAVVNKEVKQKLGIQTGKIEVLAMLTRLRQLCLDRRLVDETVTVPSSKLNACMELIESLQDGGKKVLVFSAFTSFLSLVEEQLKQRNISYYLLEGSTDKTERQRLVSQFQMDHTTVFLISLKAGGTGLNLTKAEAVIHLDPWWNISAQNQATDRAHRIGQKNPVTVYKLVMKDSIEERIMELQEKKKGIADVFVENSSTGIGSMSEADWLELFEIPIR